MAKIIYVGTPDDPQTQLITEGGLSFVKGQPVEVKNKALYDRLAANPTFAPADEDPEVPDNSEEAAALKAELDARGISYRANASIASLRKLLAGEAAD